MIRSQHPTSKPGVRQALNVFILALSAILTSLSPAAFRGRGALRHAGWQSVNWGTISGAAPALMVGPGKVIRQTAGRHSKER